MILAEWSGAEIVSVDAMQVYRGMDVGTAKPTPADRSRIPHHMIDVAEPEEAYSVARFQAEGRLALGEIAGRGSRALVVGGSGLHLRALVDPLEFPPTDEEVRARFEALSPAEARRRLLLVDPEAGDHVDLENPRRVVRALEIFEITGSTPAERFATVEAEAVRERTPLFPVTILGIDPGDRIGGRVEARFQAMLRGGLIEEVRALAPRLGPTAAQAVGYRQLLGVVRDEVPVEEGVARALSATRALARRQRTFLRRDHRVEWLEWDDDPSVVATSAARRLEEAGWSS